jgi:hypothetical protein
VRTWIWRRKTVLYHALVVGGPPHSRSLRPTESEPTDGRPAAFRLLANLRRGDGGSDPPGAGARYLTLDDARDAAREILRDECVVKVAVVADTVPAPVVEWVNR